MKRVVLELGAALALMTGLALIYQARPATERTDRGPSAEVAAELAQARLLFGAREADRREIVTLTELLAGQRRVIASLEGRLGEQDRNFQEIHQAFQQLQAEKDRLREGLGRLDVLEGQWESAVRNASHVADRLRTQEETLERIETELLADREELARTILRPSVQLNGADTVGSGTLVYSGPDRAGKGCESYVLTSYHVIRNIFADLPAGQERFIKVTIYGEKGGEELRADLVAKEPTLDVALLRLQSARRFSPVAELATPEELGRIGIFSRVVAVGCPLGNDPLPTLGTVTHQNCQLQGASYWMISAPTYLGNSGGAVFLASSRRLVGVFSKIYTHGKLNPAVVPHLGLCTPLTSVRRWLQETPYSFLLAGPKEGGEVLARQG